MEQASQTSPMTGRRIYRWFLDTDQGRFVSWAETETAARRKAKRKRPDIEVLEVIPAPSLLDGARHCDYQISKGN